MSWFWDLYALCYDAITRLIPYQKMMASIIDAMKLRDGMKILDAGCGTGNLEKYILANNLDVQINAIDFSNSMLKRARKKNKSSMVKFAKIDLNMPLPYSDNCFDAVVAVNSIYSVDNIHKTTSELHRVLKPGGRLVISDPKNGSSYWKIFGAHLIDGGWKRLIINIASLLVAIIIIPELLWVGLANVIIEAVKSRGQYHFLEITDWENMLGKIYLASTYGNQNWLISHRKDGSIISEVKSLDISEISGYFIDFFKDEPWNEYQICPNCKDIDDYGPSFSWGVNDSPKRCPQCGGLLSPYWSTERVGRYLTTNPDMLAKLVFKDGNIVAWAFGYPMPDEVFYVDTVAILPDERKNGNLRHYLAEFSGFVDHAVSIGYKSIRTRTHDQAKSVQLLLRGLGFKKLNKSVEDPNRSYWELIPPSIN